MVETPYPIYFEQALNCARILARLLPFVQGNKSSFIHDMLWNRQKLPKTISTDSGDDESKGTHSSSANDTHDNNEHIETEPLAVVLVNAMFHLLFLPGLCSDDWHF